MNTKRERQVAVIPHNSQRTYTFRDDTTQLLGVAIRQRGWWGGWSACKRVALSANEIAWGQDRAAELAAMALLNGTIEGTYGEVPIADLAERAL